MTPEERAMAVDCPQCDRKAGQTCVTRSAEYPHKARRAAARRVLESSKCSCTLRGVVGFGLVPNRADPHCPVHGQPEAGE